MSRFAMSTARVIDWLALPPLESFTIALKVYDPYDVGVPVIAPVDVFSVRPGGNEPVLLHVNVPDPPVAESD
jgi:hypothetical protein